VPCDYPRGYLLNGSHANGNGKGLVPVDLPEQIEQRTFRNFTETERQQGDKREIVRVGLPLPTIARELATLTSGWPHRVDSLLFVPGPDSRPLWFSGPDNLFAYVARQLGDGDGGNPIQWVGGADKVTQGQLFAYLQQTVPAHRAVESFPHCPPLPNHYYMHADPKPTVGRALRGLLERFTPHTQEDRDLI